MPVCSICGHVRTEDAHVKPRDTFDDRQDDLTGNIIPLCPTHHDEFDAGKIGILLSKTGFLVIEEGILKHYESKMNLHHLRDEYVFERNQSCDLKLRLRLGMIASASYLRFDKPLS